MMVIRIITGGLFLCVMAGFDLKYQALPAKCLKVSASLALVWALATAETMMAGGITVLSLGLLMALGFLICHVTGGQLGEGDVWVFVILGLVTALDLALWTFFLAFILAGIFALVLIVVRKMHKKATMPFVPFVAIAYLLLWLGGV